MWSRRGRDRRSGLRSEHGMMLEVLTPSVQDAEQSNVSSQVLGGATSRSVAALVRKSRS